MMTSGGKLDELQPRVRRRDGALFLARNGGLRVGEVGEVVNCGIYSGRSGKLWYLQWEAC